MCTAIPVFVFTITGFMTLLVDYNIYVDDQKPTTSMKKRIVDAHRESGVGKNSSSEILFIKFVSSRYVYHLD